MKCSICKKTLLDKPKTIHYEISNTIKYSAHVCSDKCFEQFVDDINGSHVFTLSKKCRELML